MEPNFDRIEQISDWIAKSICGELSDVDLTQLDNWRAESAANERLYTELLDSTYRREQLQEMAYFTDEDLALAEFYRKHSPAQKASKLRLWIRIAGAAAAIVAIVLGLWLFTDIFHGQRQENLSASNDRLPGKVGATLTLSNGKKIRLSDAANGEIAMEAGVRVSKSEDSQLIYQIEDSKGKTAAINTLSTAKGETYVLTLPDKSKVWLNAASSLSYTTALNNSGQRLVKLQGEAYFEVTKDKAHPFIVQSQNQQVEVLGTEFNVNSYPDELGIATTLIEGSVKVREGGQQRTIIPGEQLRNTAGDLKVSKVNLDNITDWKNGEFNLEGLPLRSAMRKIARWYDVQLIIDNSVPESIISGGWISRDTKLSTILEAIERSGQVHFKLSGKKLYVSK